MRLVRLVGLAPWPAALLALAALAAPAEERVPAPTAETFAAWRAHLAPRGDEEAWRRIPWIPRLSDGVRAAEAAGKPLLLWVMNGHPLGCT